MRTIIAASLLVLLAAVACATETPEPVATTEPSATVAATASPTDTPVPSPTVEPTATSTPTTTPEPTNATRPITPTPTPTIDQTLLSFLLCDRLRAKLEMTWGQAPGVIYSGDPRVTGQIMPGDYVRLLMSKPNADGLIRVKVFPHDFRAVGQTDNQVWIDWDGLTLFRLERTMFECED